MKRAATLNPNIDGHVRAFLSVLNAGNDDPLWQLSTVEARAILIEAQKAVDVDLSGITVTNKIINQDGQSMRIAVFKPAGAQCVLPVFLFFHGGGWELGDFPSHERLVRDLVVESGAAAVFVHYTPSPEAHYPVAINQAYAATKWVAAHGDEIGVDGNRLAVVGNSVGGNLAAAVSLMAKDKKGPKIKLQVLLWPVTDANFDRASYLRFATGFLLSRDAMIWCWDNYTMNPKERNEIYASPLRATLDQLKGLPETLIQTAGYDVLRDEGEAYARKLYEAGVKVAAIRYTGMIHDWGLLNPLCTIPGTRSALLRTGAAIRKALK
jgi:acetyl esterase/lipase